MIAFTDEGDGNPVVFIHGHPFNRTMWDPQIERFKKSFRVIAPDLIGYGQAPIPAGAVATTLEEFANAIVCLLDRLAVTRAVIVGLSMGGQIAMEFARAYPSRLAGLALVATFAEAETSDGVVARNTVAKRIETDGIVPVGCETLPKLIGHTTLRRNPKLASDVFAMIAATSPLGAAAALRGRALRRDYRADLRNVAVPGLVIVGTEDAYTSVEDAERMSLLMPDAQIEVFQQVGHMPNLEDPEHFNEVLAAFLARCAW